MEKPKEEKSAKKENKVIIDESKENPKLLNKSNDNIRFYRRNIVIKNPNDVREIIEGEEKIDFNSGNQNNNFSEITIEKRVITEEEIEKNPKVGQNVYKKRKFINNNDDYTNKLRMPRNSFEEKKYIKRTSYQPSEMVYSKKIIDENNNNNENPYDFNIKNIRIKIKKENFEEDDDDIYHNRKIKNTPFQNYNNAKQLNYEPKYISTNFDDESSDNSGRFDKYRRKNFAQRSYDHINEVEDLNDDNQKNNTRDNNYDIRYRDFYKRNINEN